MNKDILAVGLNAEQWETILLLLALHTAGNPDIKTGAWRVGFKHLQHIKADIEAQVSL